MAFSRFVLGTVQFGMDYGIANTQGKPSMERVKAILRCALNGGITALDTAAAYGDSEIVLGRALSELGVKDKFDVVTKIPSLEKSESPEGTIRASLEKSLKNLGMEHIPMALLHCEEDLQYLPLLEEQVKRGLIGAAGISIDSYAYADKVVDTPCVQVPCNLLDRRFNELIGKRTGRQTFIRSVYLQGLLMMPEEKIPDNLRELIPYRRKLEALGMPLAELCVRYLFSMPGNVSVLTGVDTPEQLQMNIELADKGALPADIFNAALEAVPLLPERLIRPSLWNASR